MRRFRHLFSILFVIATLLGALHEVIHHHPQDIDGKYEQSCPLYSMAQTPALPAEVFALQHVSLYREPYIAQNAPHSIAIAVSSRNRSPPLS